jgi:phosphatidate cytidylyltransferase
MPALPQLAVIFVATLVALTPIAILAGRRGGRYRAMPGWIAAWGWFAVLIIVLSRLSRAVSFPLLGVVMFGALKQYFTLTPLRPHDRWATLAAFVSIPLALWPTWAGSFGLLSAATVIGLFLLIPVMLSIGPRQPGLLDSLGRLLLGVLVFVFCAAHFGLMTQLPAGSLELFGIVGVMADLPQRLAGRMRPGGERTAPLVGVVAGVALAAGAGALLAPMVSHSSLHGGIAGSLVALSIAGGSLVSDAVGHDLAQSQSDTTIGRAAFLDRTMPVIYAAPIFYHYLRAVSS